MLNKTCWIHIIELKFRQDRQNVNIKSSNFCLSLCLFVLCPIIPIVNPSILFHYRTGLFGVPSRFALHSLYLYCTYSLLVKSRPGTWNKPEFTVYSAFTDFPQILIVELSRTTEIFFWLGFNIINWVSWFFHRKFSFYVTMGSRTVVKKYCK